MNPISPLIFFFGKGMFRHALLIVGLSIISWYLKIEGIDISNYALKHSKDEISHLLSFGNAVDLPYESNYFDLVISITTIHNLEYDECIKALKEINRVSKKNAFITVDAYRNDEEKKRMYEWNLTARTILHVDEWKELFDKAEYRGDYYWFIP